jgi:hypothetical protein
VEIWMMQPDLSTGNWIFQNISFEHSSCFILATTELVAGLGFLWVFVSVNFDHSILVTHAW